MAEQKNGITYAEAGVDIDAGNALVERIKPAAKRTNRAGVMAGLGGFGGLFDLKAAGYNDPILVAATDGVGTMYAAEDFDLAGFSVGAMERGSALPAGVSEGDVLLGLTSDGVHSNGYSLVRKIVEITGLSWDADCPFGNGTLGQALLAPTRLYVKPALAAIAEGGVHGFAHITGGGLTENIPRVLPDGLGARIDLNAWNLPPVFAWLAAQGGIAESEMLKTFNAGIGMVVVVAPDRAEAVRKALAEAGETVVALGSVIAGQGVSYDGALL